jgi:hypothetical protein
MLTAGQTTLVKFKVNVMGSSNEPKVRLILGTSPELSFAAQSSGEGWEAQINVPVSIAPGSYDMRVEVVLNNRLFTPFTKKVEVAMGVEAELPHPQAEVAPVAAPAEAAPEVQEVAPEETVVATPAPEKLIVQMPQVVAKMPEFTKKVAEVAKPAALNLLADIAKQQPKRRFEAMSSGMPSGTAKPKAAPIKIKISEIDAVTSKAVSKIVETCATAKVAQSKKKQTSKTPIKLVKEHLIYE